MERIPPKKWLSNAAAVCHWHLSKLLMKRTLPPDEHARFSGSLRHYHRAGGQTQRSWDDWVEGTTAKSRKSGKWLKVFGIIVAVLALVGIIIGLIVELS
jgi:hypothetical protein